jgi:hypothetical protein
VLDFANVSRGADVAPRSTRQKWMDGDDVAMQHEQI